MSTPTNTDSSAQSASQSQSSSSAQSASQSQSSSSAQSASQRPSANSTQSDSHSSAQNPSQSASPSSAKIHDLGYKRYLGTRTPQSTRYRTILHNVVSSAWRGWWRMKIWVFTAAVTVFVLGTIIHVGGNQDISMFARAGKQLTVGEALLPWSFNFLRWSSFALSLSVVASIIANDLRAGAFEFYFSRPVRPIDYVLGKLGGALMIMSVVQFVMPTLLAIYRIGMLGTNQIAASLLLVPKTMLVGTIATLIYAIVPLAFSALSARSRYTLFAWAAFYIIATPIVAFIGMRAGPSFLAALDIPTAINALAFAFFDMQPIMGPPLPSAGAAIGALIAYVALALLVIYWRVSAAERAGLGGG